MSKLSEIEARDAAITKSLRLYPISVEDRRYLVGLVKQLGEAILWSHGCRRVHCTICKRNADVLARLEE